MLKPYRWFKVLVKVIGVAIILIIAVESLSIISPPNAKHFKTYFKLDKTHFQIGEGVPVVLRLSYLHFIPWLQSVRIRYREFLFDINVYDEGENLVFSAPPLIIDTLGFRSLRSHIPYEERGGSLFPESITLDKPGRYKLVARASFAIDDTFFAIFKLQRAMFIETDPFWIEVVEPTKRE